MTVDRRLLAACSEFHRYDRQVQKAEVPGVEAFTEEEMARIHKGWYWAIERVTELPARTAPAIQAKAAVAARCMESVTLGNPGWGAEEWLAMAVLQEMAQGAKV